MKAKTPDNLIIEYMDFRQFLPWVTQLAFILALALVTGRAMMLETLREPFDMGGGSTAAPRGCGPAGSVVLDLLCCLPALLILLRRILDKTYIVRLSWASALFALFAGWALLSTFWAGDKFQSLVLAMHLVAGAAILWAMSQLVRSWLRLRIVAGMCMGLLLVYVAHGLMYKYIDVPETVRYWKEHRTEEMRARNWQEGDFALAQYEKKLIGGEMIGFHASPNTFAATLVLISVVVAGVGIQRLKNRDESGVIGATFLPIFPALLIISFTRSNSALLTPLIAGAILLTVAYARRLLNRKRKMIFFGCVGAVVLGILALVGHGIFHGSLPSASLNFRWRYWVASMDIFKAHPLLGIGYGNFGYWYLGARLPAAAEEIKDPHNILVRAMTELGIVGAVLLVAWLGRVWWEWTTPNLPADAAPKPKSAGSEYGPGRMFLTISALSIAGVIVKIFAGIDFSSDPGWVGYELLKHLVFAALMLIGYAIVVVISTKEMSIDARPAPWVLYAMLAGVGVFLIHNAIDFSFFEISPMLLFMAIGGAVLGIRSPSAAGMKKRTSVAIVAITSLSIAWVIAVVFIAIPLIDAENRAYAGMNAFGQQNYRLAGEHFSAAYLNAPVRNADYATRAAGALRGVPDSDALVQARLSDAVAANPVDPMVYLTRARYTLERHPNQQADIRRDFDKAMALNPNDIETRLEYARLLDTFGDRTGAALQYQAALKTNEGYDPTEPKRLKEAQVSEINARLGQ